MLRREAFSRYHYCSKLYYTRVSGERRAGKTAAGAVEYQTFSRSAIDAEIQRLMASGDVAAAEQLWRQDLHAAANDKMATTLALRPGEATGWA